MSNRKASGFTLIELVVVVAITGVILPVIFGLFFISLQSQQKALIIQETKRNGDNALSVIDDLIRTTATKVVGGSGNEICDAQGDTVDLGDTASFEDEFGNTFTFTLDSSDPDSYKIASQSSVAATINLTSDRVSVPTLSFSCTRTSMFSFPIISIQFSVTQAGDPGRQELKDTLDYSASVKLRRDN